MSRFERIVVVAPTRSICVNIQTVLTSEHVPKTFLIRERSAELLDAITCIAEGGFGVVAGTGTGKTVATRDICRQILGSALRIDIVTREHDATDYTWACNVLIVTPGVALHWLKMGKLSNSDLFVLDEVHQTSEHLELSMALAKKFGCTFVWMSATVDPTVYASYLDARRVVICEAFDPGRKAEVIVRQTDMRELDSVEAAVLTFISEEADRQRNTAVFVPTRAMAERLAQSARESISGLHADFYHGGEPAEKLRAFLTGEIPYPFAIFMTVAGASSLNITGLDTVVIVDQWYSEVIRSGGVRSLERRPLGHNELLQMGGRVNGRTINGKILILTNRDLDFHALRPASPDFVLGGDLEQLALCCARVGVDAKDLDLIGHFDHPAYEKVMCRLSERGLIAGDAEGQPMLTELGKRVERLPVRPAWGEVLTAAQDQGDKELFQVVTLVSCIEQLHKLLFQGVLKRDFIVNRSDHLTAYSIVATALRQFGFIKSNGNGVEYSLRGDWWQSDDQLGEFRLWCKQMSVSAKEVRNVLLALRSVFRQLGQPLPDPQSFPQVISESPLYVRFVELLASVQAHDYVRDEYHSSAGVVFATRGGATSARSILGRIRFWNDKKNRRRASIEGTEIPEELVRKYSQNRFKLLGISGGKQARLSCEVTFAGERISTETSAVPVEGVPEELEDELQQALLQLEPTELIPNETGPPKPETIEVDGVSCLVTYDLASSIVWATVRVPLAQLAQLTTLPALPNAASVDRVEVVNEEGVVVASGYSLTSIRNQIERIEREAREQAERQQFLDEVALLRQRCEELATQGRAVNNLRRILASTESKVRLLYISHTSRENVRQLIRQAEREIERLSGNAAEVLLDDLMTGRIAHPDIYFNQQTIAQIAIYAIRSGGFVEIPTDEWLRQYYQNRLDGVARVDEVLGTNLRLQIEDFAPADVLAELELAPETVELVARKGTATYNVTYTYAEIDGQRIAVGVLSVPISAYERNNGRFPNLPHGIRLVIEVADGDKVIARGEDGDRLRKLIEKYQKAKRRGGFVPDTDEFGFKRRTPITAEAPPPWYKRPR